MHLPPDTYHHGTDDTRSHGHGPKHTPRGKVGQNMHSHQPKGPNRHTDSRRAQRPGRLRERRCHRAAHKLEPARQDGGGWPVALDLRELVHELASLAHQRTDNLILHCDA